MEVSCKRLWIAFKLYKFDILKTTGNESGFGRDELWIAFKLYKFDILKTTWFNGVSGTCSLWIAFKLYKFDILKTTSRSQHRNRSRLWIAFKLYKFDILKTTKLITIAARMSCELLSNFINLTYWKQLYLFSSCSTIVVNCFQTL